MHKMFGLTPKVAASNCSVCTDVCVTEPQNVCHMCITVQNIKKFTETSPLSQITLPFAACLRMKFSNSLNHFDLLDRSVTVTKGQRQLIANWWTFFAFKISIDSLVCLLFE